MSARDSASGSSTYKGGSGGAGGLGNGGVGGGMGGGYRGGGAGYNGGAGSRTGLTTGATTYGNTAFGRPGGNAVAYGMRDAASLGRAGMGPTVGSFGNFRTPSGAAMFGNSSVQGQSFYGRNMGQALSQANRAQARQPQAKVDGLLGGAPIAASAPAYSAVEQEMALPTYQDPMSIYTTLTPVPGVPTPSTALPNANWLRTNSMLNAPNVTGRAYDARLSPSPDALANDMSRFNKPNGAPLNIGGIQGGMGSPAYSNPGTPGFGGRR